MTYAEHHIGELHEFLVTPQLLANLAQCIERDCQLPAAEEADTPELLFLKVRHRAAGLQVAVHRILLTFIAAEPPVLDTGILDRIASLQSTAATARCLFDSADALPLP